VTSPPVTRAMLIGADGETLNCQFNPETMQRSKTAKWQDHPTRGAGKQVRHQFVGIGPDQLKVKLLFDSFDTLGASNAEPVEDSIDTLFDWLAIPPSSQGKATPQPPTVTFQWGSGVNFLGILTNVVVQYVMFSAHGAPIRAYATVTLAALPDTPAGTNPTSGSIPGRTSAQMREGDTLASIAYSQYGDPNLWRAIALANGIEDPARVAIGTRLLVPPRTAAVALSAPEPPAPPASTGARGSNGSGHG
jgi:hypothetical protein